MDRPVFDAAAFVAIDLSTGEISSAGNDRLTLVPTDILSALSPGDGLVRAAEKWGKQHGRRLAEQMEKDGEAVGMEALASYLSGTIAALGMGRVSIELLQDALMFRAKSKGGEGLSEGERDLLSGFLAGYLSALGEHQFSVLHMGEDAGDQLFWAGNPDAVDKVRGLSNEGQSPLTAVRGLIEGSL